MTRSRWFAAFAALIAAAVPASAVDYLFVQPTTGTTGNMSTSANWAGGLVPASGTGNTIAYTAFGSNTNAYTLTNDIGALTVNSLTFGRFGTGLFTQALGANALTLDGTNPALVVTGPGNGVISGAGGVVLAGTTGVSGAGNGYLNISSVVSGAGGFTVNQSGLGIFSLTGANTFTGGVTLTNGYLQLGTATALGDAANVLTVNGGAVRFGTTGIIANSITANNNLIIAGGTGALTGTSTPTVTGIISGSGGLVLQSSGTTGGVNLQGVNSYSGVTVVNSAVPTLGTALSGPTLTLSGAAGSITPSAAITIGRNATLVVGGTTANGDRLGDAAPIALNGGRITFVPVAAGTSELAGALTISGLANLSTTASGISAITFGGLTRQNNAALWLASGAFGTINSATTATRVFFTGGLTGANAPLTAGSGTGTETAIVPFATSAPLLASGTNPDSLVTYDDVNGLQSIARTNSTYFVQVAGAAAFTTALGNGSLANQNAHLNGSGTYNLGGAALTLNSLAATSSTVALTNGTLSVFSGAIVNYDHVSYGAGLTLAFGPRTGYIHSSYSHTFLDGSTITGSGGLVISGGGYLASGGTGVNQSAFQNTAGNPFTGGLFLNGNVAVGFRQDNQLGAVGESITMNGGRLAYNALASLDVARPIVLGTTGGGVTFNVIPSANATTGNATAATVLTLSGVISGNGTFFKQGIGTVNLTGTNTFTGGTVVQEGPLQFTTNANLGDPAGKITLNGGTLQPLAAVSLARGIDVNASSTILAANALTLSGPIVNVGALYGTASPTLTKTGAGVLSVTGDGSKFNGTVALSAGGLTVSGAAGTLSQATAVTLAAGTTLTLDNSTGTNGNRLGDGTAVTLNGAGTVVSYIAGSTATSDPAERFGVLNNTVAGGVFSITGGSASPTLIRIGALNATAGLTIRGTDLGETTGNYTRLLIDAFTANVSIIPNVFFANTAGTATSTTLAGYDTVRGLVLFTPVPTSGTTINNFSPDSTPLGAAYTTTGNATATTGVQIYTLTLDGGTTLTLNGGNAAGGTNGNTPDGTLLIAGGVLTSQNGPKTISSAAARTVAFGASAAVVTTTSNLTLEPTVALTGSGTFTKAGAGTLTVNGTYGITGDTNVSAGTLAFGAPVTLNNLTGAGSVNAGAFDLTFASSVATTFSGGLTAGTLTKSGTAALTLSPSSAAAVSGLTTIAGGSLVIGNANAAPLLANYALNGGSIDLNGQPSPSLPTIAGGTANGVTNSNATTASVVTAAVATDTTLAVAFSGNVTVNKTGTGTLLLTGTGNVTPVPAAAGTINVNEGVLQLNTGGQGIGNGMNITVAAGAAFRYLANSTSNVTHPFGTVTLNGGSWENIGASYYDTTLNRLVVQNGGSYTVTATGTPYIIFSGAGAAFQSNAGTVTNVIGTGTPVGNSFHNSSPGPLPLNVAAGSTPSGIDVDFGVSLTSIGTNPNFNKTGPGVAQLRAVANTGVFTVSAGVLQVAAGAGITGGATTVNGGVLRGSGTTTAVTVNAGGAIQGGSGSATGTLTTGTVTFNGSSTLRTVAGGSGFFATAGTISTGTNAFNAGTGSLISVVLVNDGTLLLDSLTPSTVTLATYGSTNIPFDGGGLPTANIAIGTPEGFSYFGTPTLNMSGSLLTITFVAAPVPEPATVLAVAAVGLGLGRVVRRRFAAK